MSGSVAFVWVRGYACPLFPLFALHTRLSFLSLFLALMRADPTVVGLGICVIALEGWKSVCDRAYN